jgi:hypothetical protein
MARRVREFSRKPAVNNFVRHEDFRGSFSDGADPGVSLSVFFGFPHRRVRPSNDGSLGTTLRLSTGPPGGLAPSTTTREDVQRLERLFYIAVAGSRHAEDRQKENHEPLDSSV